MAKQNKLFSFIIPVYNTGNYLFETLDSINNQDFDLNDVEVIIVNDCSTDTTTNHIISDLALAGCYKQFPVNVIQNKKNKWLAETRNVGARVATGDYLVCLDSDDTIERDFLKLSLLTFAAYPTASWVYPSVRKFGYKNQSDIAPCFNAKNLFVKNYLVAASPVKRSLWNELNGQRTLHLANGVKLYEDWDFWQRAIGKGAYGVPIKKVLFNYRQNIRSLVTRSEDEGSLSSLLAYKKNWSSLFGIKKSQREFQLINDNHTVNRSFINRVFQKVSQLTIKRTFANVKPKDILLYLFWTSKFIEQKMNPVVKYTKAHKMAGFIEGFKLDFDRELPVCIKPSNQVLVTHFWWHVGGAENILLSYIKELKYKNLGVIDVVIKGSNTSGVLKNEFGKYADGQFTLAEIADGPYPMLLALWEIIKTEKPSLILNMSNPLLYILAPLIKEKFPNTMIYDLLHCEDYDDNGWFEAAYQYQNYIDKRIVTSDFWKQVLVEKYQEIPAKIEVLYNMIDYEKFSHVKADRASLLTSHGIHPSKKVVGFLGRLHHQKRPDIFIALAELMQGNKDYHFVMVGEGEMFAELQPRITKLSNLSYLGVTRYPELIYPMFDVAVFPSKYEGYPLVGIECAFVGLPIIASNIVGFREQINEGGFGILYDIKGDEEDPEAIKNILVDRFDELIALGQKGPDFVAKYHNQANIKKEIQRIFSI
jgi:glycosyltransferase involved in cell wall biosynthesis